MTSAACGTVEVLFASCSAEESVQISIFATRTMPMLAAGVLQMSFSEETKLLILRVLCKK